MADAPAPAVTGPPTGPVPAPPPVQAAPAPRPARLRRPGPPNRNVTDVPHATGVPSILRFAEAYALTPDYQQITSTYTASTIAMFAWTHVADMRMSQNDRFLKSNPLWHPLITQLYVSILYFIHLLQVGDLAGTLTPHESLVFSTLKEKYPLAYLPVPGYLVHFFSSITTTAAPYTWLGNIAPSIPALSEWRQDRAYRLANGYTTVIPSIWLIIDQLHFLLSSDVIVEHASFEFYRNIFGANLTQNAEARHLLNAPNARFSVSLSGRVDRSFQQFAASGAPGARVIKQHVLDLPRRPETGNSTVVDGLEFYMGFFDLSATTSRRDRMYTWLDQILPVMSAYCRFITDSRPLSSIAAGGLGAATPIWQYAANTIKIGDPFANPVTTNVAEAIASMQVQNLTASVESRDPELDSLAVQYSVASQVNVDFLLNGNDPAPNVLRTGPFWDMPVCDIGSDFRLDGMMAASIGSVINYVSN